MSNNNNGYPSSLSAWVTVTILMVAYVLSFIDRQILNLLVGPIRRDLDITDTQMSLLMGLSFALFYTVCGIPLGRLADTKSRRGLIAVGVLFWSAATAACGMAKQYWQFLLCRVGVGVGEAALSPAAYSLIADYFPKEQRARALAAYSFGIPVGSALGILWSVLNPLLTCLVMWAVFGALFNQRGDGIEDFPLFLIIGQLMFNFFRESTSMAMESVLKNGPLLRKVYIPKYIFPLEKCCFALVNFFFSLVALFFVALVTWSHISLRTVLLAVYPIVMLFVFSLGVGLILSTMYVFVRDIMHIWEVFCTLLVYGSAIFYDPSQMASWMQAVINLNPIYWYITAVRSCVMWGTGLTLNMVLIPFLCSALSLGIGVYVFKKNQDKFVLYM